MTADHLTHLDQFGADLWELADQLRANSGLASNEYFMPILGLLFLRHATNRYYAARKADYCIAPASFERRDMDTR